MEGRFKGATDSLLLAERRKERKGMASNRLILFVKGPTVHFHSEPECSVVSSVLPYKIQAGPRRQGPTHAMYYTKLWHIIRLIGGHARERDSATVSPS